MALNKSTCTYHRLSYQRRLREEREVAAVTEKNKRAGQPGLKILKEPV
jgi:hypothetical protein